jgi:2-C-methyl-D-erythritol 4-phosphate cytidylyltransferase
MSRRPASVTQADIARAIRAAKQAGAAAVEIKPDGTIHIALSPRNAEETVDRSREIVL